MAKKPAKRPDSSKPFKDLEIYNALQVYRERAYYLKRLEAFERAKASFDEGFKSNPDDVRNLIGRSQVCSDAVQPKNAFEDAELALKLEPQNMLAHNVQARALYSMSEFEKSLVMNSRGYRIRQKPSYFLEGKNQCIETIQDCIGKNAGDVMQDFLPIIKIQEALHVKQSKIRKSLHKCRIPRLSDVHKLSQSEVARHLLLSRVLAMKYLGPMAYDKFFLENLRKDRRVKSANAKGSSQIEVLVNQAFESLCNRQEMLRAQRPYHTIKLTEMSESKYQNKFQIAMLAQERLIATRTAERYQRDIETCLKEGRVKDLISLAERFQKFLDNKSTKTLRDKEQYIDKLYRNIGEAYLSQHRLSFRLSDRSNRRRIAFLMGLKVERPTSYDSVMANYPRKYFDLKEVTNKVMNTLDMCENATMRCWLLYEIAHLLGIQKNYSLSKFYARRCQREARHICEPAWWLNACFVLISGDMRQGNSAEVHLQVAEALEVSKQITDPEQLQTFLNECSRMVAETLPEDERKGIAQREKQILSVMEEDQSVETKILFKKILTLPRGRRFSVLPRKDIFDAMKNISKAERRKQRGMTVIPGKEKPIQVIGKSTVPGFLQLE